MYNDNIEGELRNGRLYRCSLEWHEINGWNADLKEEFDMFDTDLAEELYKFYLRFDAHDFIHELSDNRDRVLG